MIVYISQTDLLDTWNTLFMFCYKLPETIRLLLGGDSPSGSKSYPKEFSRHIYIYHETELGAAQIITLSSEYDSYDLVPEFCDDAYVKRRRELWHRINRGPLDTTVGNPSPSSPVLSAPTVAAPIQQPTTDSPPKPISPPTPPSSQSGHFAEKIPQGITLIYGGRTFMATLDQLKRGFSPNDKLDGKPPLTIYLDKGGEPAVRLAIFDGLTHQPAVELDGHEFKLNPGGWDRNWNDDALAGC